MSLAAPFGGGSVQGSMVVVRIPYAKQLGVLGIFFFRLQLVEILPCFVPVILTLELFQLFSLCKVGDLLVVAAINVRVSKAKPWLLRPQKGRAMEFYV